MFESLFRFIDRTCLDPELMARDDAVVAGEGPHLAATFLDAAAQADGGVAWGRISYRYLAGQRIHAVIGGACWWDEHHNWPPPHDGGDLPDEIATLAELLTLLAGDGVELSDPRPISAGAWVAALPAIAHLSVGGLLADPDEFAGPYNQTEARLTHASGLTEAWLIQDPTIEPSDELWDALDALGGLEGLLNDVSVVLERPMLVPQMRGATRSLLNAGAVSGVPELRAAHALRVVCHGAAAVEAAFADRSLHQVPFLDALDALRAFLDLVNEPPVRR